MEIISGVEFETVIHYEIFFQWKDSTLNHGFGFKADKHGNIDMAELEKKPAALANYNKCVSGEHAVTGPTLKSWEHSFRVNVVGKCQCGCEVELAHFTNTCDGCNRDYNGSGQLLADRSQWGEETGESYCDLQDL